MQTWMTLELERTMHCFLETGTINNVTLVHFIGLPLGGEKGRSLRRRVSDKVGMKITTILWRVWVNKK